MDSYEWNKIIGWLLAAAIAVLGLSIVTGFAYPGHSEGKGYVVEGVELEATGGAEAPAAVPIAALLTDASIAKGEAQFKKCATCHTINKGGPNNQGPNQFGVVGDKVAAQPGFSYSEALKAHGGVWGFDELNAWIESPRKYIPGNKMSFAGISKPEDRADLIAYLNSQSDNPLPLPAKPAIAAAATPAPETAAAGEAPAADAAAAPPTH